jgi:hypothetical protein
MSKLFPRLREFTDFVTERWNIHQRRLEGKPAPWTKDPILQKYRFTNVRRNDDRVTKWIHGSWLLPHATDYDTVVFAMCLARLVNLPATMEELGYPERWNPQRFVRIMDARRERGLCAYNNAYMINAVGATKGQSKASYLSTCVLGPLWSGRKALGEELRTCTSLRGLHNSLMQFHGFGAGFMAAQVVGDVKYTPAGKNADDWHTFAASGPGSRRGLNWVTGRDVTERWNEEEWHSTLLKLMDTALPKLPSELHGLSAQDTQNTLCEIGKYFKVKYLGRRAKQHFTPSEETYV